MIRWFKNLNSKKKYKISKINFLSEDTVLLQSFCFLSISWFQLKRSNIRNFNCCQAIKVAPNFSLLKPPLSMILNPLVRFGSLLLNAALLLLLSLPFQPHQAAVWDKKYKLGVALYGSAQHRISEEQTGTWAPMTIRMTFIRWYNDQKKQEKK